MDFIIALRNLAQHTKRTLFLGGALAAVTALMVFMNGIIDGAQGVLLESGSTLITGHVNVGGFYKPTAGSTAPMILDYEKVLKDLEGQIPEADYHVVRDRGYAKGVADTGAMDMVIAGIDIRNEPGLKRILKPLEGSLEELEKPNTLLIFAAQQKRLGVKAGDTITLSAPTARGMSNTLDVRIAAVAKDIGILSGMCAYMPTESLHRLYQSKASSTGAVQIYLKDPYQSKQVAARLRTVLQEKGWTVLDPDPQPYYMKLLVKLNREDWTGQRLDVTTYDDELSFVNYSLMAMRFASVMLTVILSIIVFAGIMSTMWIAIRERTREIGTLRAIGISRLRIWWLFLLESFMLGAFSSVVGAVIGILACLGVNALRFGLPESVQMFLLTDHLQLRLVSGWITFAVVFITALATLASILPSIRAARLKPVTAMQHVG